MCAVTSGKAGINLYLGLAFVLNITRPTSTVFASLIDQLLLSQRALLYLGAQQKARHHQFEDLVLDSTPYVDAEGKQYTGLQAMLANRMQYQRDFFGYDIFISEQDLDRSAEEFVGLARRYLAAAEPEDLQ